MAKKIKPHSTGPGFEATFKNGTLDIPDQQGSYLISTGCGAGKTEGIKELIAFKQDEGIIYCVDTKAEVDKMYDYLKKNGIVAENDMLRLHGDATTELDAYRDHPENIMQKKVILLTHVRFWSDLIHYFLIFKPLTDPGAFDGDFAALMMRGDLRKWVLFDETPLFYLPFAIIIRAVLGCLSEKSRKGWKCKNLGDMKDSYMKFVDGTSEAFTKGDHRLNRLKRETTLAIIPRFWDAWMEKGKQDKMELQFYPTDICQKNIKTHILFYEGVGDVLLRGLKHISLLDIPGKYNSTVDFIPLDVEPQKRSEKFDPTTFDNIMDEIEKTLKAEEGNKTLIVCWKNIGSHTDNLQSGKSAWKELIDADLTRRGFLNGTDYSITYYGAADTKSTNQYRDYQNIILLGDWNTPESFAAQVRTAFNSTTTIEDYRVWYYAQLICRIGIRDLAGGSFRVYYTKDYKPLFINQLNKYLNMNQYTPKSKPKNKKRWFDDIAKACGIREPQKGDIEKLATMYPDLKTEIETGHSYTLTIPLAQLTVICPRKEKRRRAYLPLEKALGKLHITLVIS